MKKLHNGFKKKFLMMSLILLAVFSLSFFFDMAIASSISSLQKTWINNFMIMVSYTGSSFLIILLSSCLLFHDRKKMFFSWLSFSLTSLAVLIFKVLISRTRPFQELGLNTIDFMIKNSYYTWNSSFPSFHAALIFSVLPFFKGKIRIFWIFFACLISFSRLFFAVHYLSDLIAGAVMGLSTGFIIINLFHLRKRI